MMQRKPSLSPVRGTCSHMFSVSEGKRQKLRGAEEVETACYSF